jgi:CHAT domain-containing protein
VEGDRGHPSYQDLGRQPLFRRWRRLRLSWTASETTSLLTSCVTAYWSQAKPFDASFELHGDNLTLLDIVRSQLPTAEFAFLSACHTAELTEDSIADEGLHIAAAMQFCGFRSVVGTMWAMADTDGADLSKHFYKSIFAESTRT